MKPARFGEAGSAFASQADRLNEITRAQIRLLAEPMATKEDLQDLRQEMATKTDLQATKADLQELRGEMRVIGGDVRAIAREVALLSARKRRQADLKISARYVRFNRGNSSSALSRSTARNCAGVKPV
jgi:hypothetical protein